MIMVIVVVFFDGGIFMLDKLINCSDFQRVRLFQKRLLSVRSIDVVYEDYYDNE